MATINHLACIMDGNRRWARTHGLLNVGRQGAQTAYRAAEYCVQKDIQYLSLFAFSAENFTRSPHEVTHLFDLIVSEIQNEQQRFIDNNMCIRFIGDRARLPLHVQQACTALEAATEQGTALYVQILIAYGARQEIVAATRRLAQMVHAGEIAADDITQELFEKQLWTAGIPDPDLIIRTGGAQRLSNFLLYQAAYAELYFTPTLWPAMQEKDFDDAVSYFAQCKRNFGS